MNKLILSAFALVVAVAAAPAADDKKEKVDNPEFANWSKFKAGTVVTLKTKSEFGTFSSEGKMTNKLVEVKDDKAVVESEITVTAGGKETKLPASKREILKQVEVATLKGADPKSGKPAGTTEEGKEKIKIGGTEYECKWYKFKSKQPGLTGAEEEVEGQMWMSDDVPGLMVKMSMKMKAGTTSVEATEITTKK